MRLLMNLSEKFFLNIYRFLSTLFLPIIFVIILLRVLQKKENKNRLFERFGFASKNPSNEVIWLHAVSVGETNSALILVEELLKILPKNTILFTTTTLTSAKILQEKIAKFNGKVLHQFLPVDSYFCVERFLNYWQPKLCLFIESEIWPNFIFSARKKNIPTFLINGRISEKSSLRWLKLKELGFNIFDNFSGIFAQSESDKNRLQQLTKNQVLCYGNLKSQAQKLQFDEQKLQELKFQIGARKIWLCASTHKGEEELLLQVHSRLKSEFPDLLTILLLRHPNRASEVCELLKDFNFSQRSKNQNITDLTEIYLADSLNELGIFYRLADFAFIAGSLAKVGGHNPYEAIYLDCAIITGNQVFNFSEIYRDLVEKEACVMIKNTEELFNAVRNFLLNKDLVSVYASNAQKLVMNSENISQKIVKKIFSNSSF